MDRKAERKREIDGAVADIRAIEAREGISRSSLEKMKERLIRLATRRDLFSTADYAPPVPGGKMKSCLYRVSEDTDHRFALYVNSSFGAHITPPHNHTTWAVIVGISGDELNHFYDRVPDGVRERAQLLVKEGTGIALMPDDLHSTHIQTPLLNLHMYGLALDQLHSREFYNAEERIWLVFPAHADIRDAR
jgi:predicted metal-dependent enzyme (double-stranded beta helix superfamily)